MSRSKMLLALLFASPVTASTLDVVPEAAWSGDFGLAVALTDGTPAYVETTTPNEETRYIVRFYFNADATSVDGGSLALFQALSAAFTPVVTVWLQSDGSTGKELVYAVVTDSGGALSSAIPLAPGWHFLELDWAAATGGGTNDGALATRLDDVPTAGLAMLDNDQSTIASARWGAVQLASGPSGTLWIDDFESWRAGSIGPILAGSLDLDGDGSPQPLTDGLLYLRSFFGFTWVTLTSGAVGYGCKYCTAPQIQSRLVALQAILDVDEDGSVAPPSPTAS